MLHQQWRYKSVISQEYTKQSIQHRCNDSGLGCARFALKIFLLISEVKRIGSVSHVFRLFTIKFHFYFFASFRLFSLRLTLVIFVSKRNKAKRNSSLFFRFFRFFHFCSVFSLFFPLNFSLRLDLVIFALKFSLHIREIRKISLQFNTFRVISLPNFISDEKKHFYWFFRLIFVSLQFFRLIFAYFNFVFASDFWCFAPKWIMWNQAFFRFQAKRNICFNFKFRFRSESEGAPYTGQLMGPSQTKVSPCQ